MDNEYVALEAAKVMCKFINILQRRGVEILRYIPQNSVVDFLRDGVACTIHLDPPKEFKIFIDDLVHSTEEAIVQGVLAVERCRPPRGIILFGNVHLSCGSPRSGGNEWSYGFSVQAVPCTHNSDENTKSCIACVTKHSDNSEDILVTMIKDMYLHHPCK